MGSPININIRVIAAPEAQALPPKKVDETVKKAEDVAQKILEGHKIIAVNALKLSKKLLVKLIRDVLPDMTLKVIKAIPGILLLAVG